jgi:hypothetical protein
LAEVVAEVARRRLGREHDVGRRRSSRDGVAAFVARGSRSIDAAIRRQHRRRDPSSDDRRALPWVGRHDIAELGQDPAPEQLDEVRVVRLGEIQDDVLDTGLGESSHPLDDRVG